MGAVNGLGKILLTGGVVAIWGLAAPLAAQELREVAPLPDYSFMHPENMQQGDGPAGTVGDLIPVPSGQKLWWVDVVHFAEGPHGLTYRFRFLAPQLSGRGAISVDVALLDLQALCSDFVAPRLANPAPEAAEVMISISDRIVPFGEAVPDAVQYFEAFSVHNGVCEWEFY